MCFIFANIAEGGREIVSEHAVGVNARECSRRKCQNGKLVKISKI
jgi:hypothetical protein